VAIVRLIIGGLAREAVPDGQLPCVTAIVAALDEARRAEWRG